MRINSRAGTQFATFDGSEAGEGLAIFLSQGASDNGRYRFVVKAMSSQLTLQVGEFFSSPPNATNPNGGLSRMIGAAVCPGVDGWTVEITCMNPADPEETADVILLSSKCFTSPVGVSRVAERYSYDAGSLVGSTVTFGIPPGRKISSWTAIAPGTAGSVQLVGITNSAIITIPPGTSVSSQPGDQFLGALNTLTFTNVDYYIEYLESA